MVTMCHNPTRRAQWAQHPLPPTTIPPLHPQPSSALAAVTLSNQSLVSVGATVGGSLKAEEMHRAFSSSSNYGEQRPGTSLGYDVCPYQKNSSPACAASRTWQPADASTQSGSATALVSQQQQLASSSNNTNSVLLPPTLPTTSPSVILFVTLANHPFVSPQQPHPLQQQQHHNNNNSGDS